MNKHICAICLLLFAFSPLFVEQASIKQNRSNKPRRFVSVELAGGESVKGTFVSASAEADTLVIDKGGYTQTILLENVRRLDFSNEVLDSLINSKQATVSEPPLPPPPPASPREKVETTVSPSASHASSSVRTVAVQCGGRTKKGSRCSRMTYSSNGRCWQHGGN